MSLSLRGDIQLHLDVCICFSPWLAPSSSGCPTARWVTWLWLSSMGRSMRLFRGCWIFSTLQRKICTPRGKSCTVNAKVSALPFSLGKHAVTDEACSKKQVYSCTLDNKMYTKPCSPNVALYNNKHISG